MVHISFVDRLDGAEYLAIIGSFILVGLEAVLRILTIALPYSVLHILYRASRRIFNIFATGSLRTDSGKINPSNLVRDASNFLDLCAIFGYSVEEHVVQTGDGYILGVHRLASRRDEEDNLVNQKKTSSTKNVVYLHHGLLMNSEVWVCLTEAQRCLPFMLVDRGYDVWVGNNRGNKYSKKSIHYSPSDIPFWNFSMDQFAFHDIPDTIQYILQTTSAPSLSYIGFSQGTAQAFASLAVHPKLNDQINVFIALAPAMSPAGLSNRVVDALIKASPQVIFLLFGRRSLLSSTTMWQSILYPPIYCRLIDMALSFLFGWNARNISGSQKLAAYPHLYSFTSTKSVVHWFQIIRTKSFQMYDDEQSHFTSLRGLSKTHTKVPRFPTRNIKSPVILIYGGSDSLVDINAMLKELPPHTLAIEIPHYEHLDFLWARDIDNLVFPHVFDALETSKNRVNLAPKFEGQRGGECASQFSSQVSSNASERLLTSDTTSEGESLLPRSSSSVSSNIRLRREPDTLKTTTPETKSAATFQSNLPRPCSSAQKYHKNCSQNIFSSEGTSTVNIPKLTSDVSLNKEHVAVAASSGLGKSENCSVASHEFFDDKSLNTCKNIQSSSCLKDIGSRACISGCSFELMNNSAIDKKRPKKQQKRVVQHGGEKIIKN